MDVCENPLPLSGIRALEWGHAVMGPSCGMVLADMGAEVIKIEKAPSGDDTRYLPGFGVGLFPYFNRNKRSLALNLKDERGKEILRQLIGKADVFFENFGPGAADRLGFGYQACAALNPRLIYCNLKGFMPGPYENRPSLDNLVQMMAGLAYMTGPKGRPLRAGASVIDILGGVFGALGIITALYERERTGQGKHILSTLFESTAFLVGQHMAHVAVTGEKSIPMPEGTAPWSVYDLFETAEGDQIFIGMTSDFHWQRFCDTFGLEKLKADERLKTNNDRVSQREWMIPELQKLFKSMPKQRIVELADEAKIPFAPIIRPDQLFEDAQLNQGHGLVETTFPDGTRTKMPKLPMRLGGCDFGLRNDPPQVGEYGREALGSLGYSPDQVEELVQAGIVAVGNGK